MKIGPGEFVGLEDITLAFHGDPTQSKLKIMVLGPMRKFFSDDEVDTLKAAELADLNAVVDWSDNKAPENQYWDPGGEGARSRGRSSTSMRTAAWIVTDLKERRRTRR